MTGVAVEVDLGVPRLDPGEKRRARLAGNAGAERWTETERRYQEMVHAANRAGLEYVQEWAGMTQTGYHGTKVDA
jgi:hypothetical protein